MVLSGPNRISSISSLVNQTNVGGGVKKAGRASTVGIPASISWVYVKYLGCPCNLNFISKTRSCATPVGGIRRYRC